MISQEQLKSIVRLAIVDVIDARYDPYSIMFTYEELAVKIADIIISGSDEHKYLPLLINEVRSNLVDDGFQVETLADIRYLAKKSKRLTAILEKVVDEMIEIIHDYFIDIENPEYLFNDSEAQQIQVTQIQRWHEIRESILNQTSMKIVKEELIGEVSDERRLINVLREMYHTAPKGYQMTMVHIFGIMYAQELETLRIKDIAYNATGKRSLWVEVSKGTKLSKYIKMDKHVIGAKKGRLALNDNDRQREPSSEYRIHLTREDEEVLRINGVSICDNRRLYTCDLFRMSDDDVFETAVPRCFVFAEFTWAGSQWGSLVTELVRYIINNDNYSTRDNEEFLMKSCGHLFSESKKEGYFGPLENGWYIFLGDRPIIALLEVLKDMAHHTNETPLLSYYTRSLEEPEEVRDIILERELSAFQQYMQDRNFPSHQVNDNTKCIRKLCSLSKEKEKVEWAFLSEPPHEFDKFYSIMKDNNADLLNQSGCAQAITDFAIFKRIIKYENFNLKKSCGKNIKKRLDWDNLAHLEYSKPVSFSLYGPNIKVSSWSELVHEVIHILIQHNPNSMYRIAQTEHKIGHSKKPLVSVDRNKLRMPKEAVDNTKIFYYEGNLSARQQAKLLYELVIELHKVPAHNFEVVISHE